MARPHYFAQRSGTTLDRALRLRGHSEIIVAVVTAVPLSFALASALGIWFCIVILAASV